MKEVLESLFGDVVTEENLLEFGRRFVSRAAFERLQREQAAEKQLWLAGAKNLTAAKALLDWEHIDLGQADWQERLAEQVAALQREPETAFLFARRFDGKDWGWIGLEPVAAGDVEEEAAPGLGWRLAQAEGDSLQSIRIKQAAAKQGLSV